jgi:hypothetical protein
MALIACPECGREVSSSASLCPACAYPVATGTPPTPLPAVRAPAARPWWKTAVPILLRLALGGILLGIAAEEESVAGVTGALIVAVSAIPAWYRDKIERLRAARVERVRDGRVDERLAEMELRYREQMADLEERIDFAERLLTKQREQIGPG